MTQVSEHFTLAEFAVSASYPELVQPVPANLVETVTLLATLILEPIREYVGRPVHILSGYRPFTLNATIGGSPTSQHVRAQAADIRFDDIAEVETVFRALLDRSLAVPCGQVIYYPSRGFMHIALPSLKYPRPSFHVNDAVRRLKYEKVRSIREMDKILVDA